MTQYVLFIVNFHFHKYIFVSSVVAAVKTWISKGKTNYMSLVM